MRSAGRWTGIGLEHPQENPDYMNIKGLFGRFSALFRHLSKKARKVRLFAL